MNPTFTERLISRVKKHRATTTIIALGSVIIALSTFTDAAKNLSSLFSGPSSEEARASLARLSVPYTPQGFVAAADAGDATVVQLFLDAGIPINAPAYLEARVERLPALAAAAFEGHLEIVKLLLKSGAHVVTEHYNCLIAGSVSGNSEILEAMLRQRVAPEKLAEAFVVAEKRPILEQLERAGVDVKKVGEEAMRQATSAEMVNYLVEHGIDVNAKDDAGKTAIQQLMDNDFGTSAEVVLALIDHGADINARDRRQKTLLLRAADNGNIEMTKNLLQRKADTAIQDEKGRTALALAADTGGKRGIEIARLLLAQGANVNARDKNGATALHHAAANNDFEMVQLLVQHGANIQIKDTSGHTALSAARKSSRYEIDPKIAALLKTQNAVPD